MSPVTPWIKRAIWLLVIYCIIYLLISPLPEVGAAFSGKSILTFFVLVPYALLHLLLSALLFSVRPAGLEFATSDGFLEKICLRLC
jgi:hypothetical protein